MKNKIGILILFLTILTLLPFFQPRRQYNSIEPRIHAVEEYRMRWGINISSCEEVYYATDDHTAFGEGDRYSVLRGTMPVASAAYNNLGEKISETVGNGTDINAFGFISDVWNALEVPEEWRFSMLQCKWTLFSTEDGSKIIVVKSEDDNRIYIAEMIM